MKKLMIAAAMAATVGAFASDNCSDPTTYTCVSVYKVTFSVKTTAPIAKKTKVSCSDPEVVCYRKKASAKVAGYLYAGTEGADGAWSLVTDAEACSDACECVEAFEGLTPIFWDGKTYEEDTGAALAWDFVDRIGGKTTEKSKVVEAVGTYTSDNYALRLAGFGSWDKKNALVKSLSGNFAGTKTKADCETEVSCSDPVTTEVGTFMICTDAAGQTELTAAYGTWSLKWDKSAAKKFAKKGGLSAILPKKFTSASGSEG